MPEAKCKARCVILNLDVVLYMYSPILVSFLGFIYTGLKTLGNLNIMLFNRRQLHIYVSVIHCSTATYVCICHLLVNTYMLCNLMLFNSYTCLYLWSIVQQLQIWHLLLNSCTYVICFQQLHICHVLFNIYTCFYLYQLFSSYTFVMHCSTATHLSYGVQQLQSVSVICCSTATRVCIWRVKWRSSTCRSSSLWGMWRAGVRRWRRWSWVRSCFLCMSCTTTWPSTTLWGPSRVSSLTLR